ncbi:MAG TPA: hypothetical protein VK106_06160 [Balneolaceae bacterium]|nr:hypothetical protein [Balneolaceae bacterium]
MAKQEYKSQKLRVQLWITKPNQTKPNQTKPLIFRRFALGFVGAAFLLMLDLAACESPITSIDKPQPKDEIDVERFFSFNPDSVGPLLKMTIDTLRVRHHKNPFVANFIQEYGLPVWKVPNKLIQKGMPTFVVPVRNARKKRVTGLVIINIKNSDQPVYTWVPRGIEFKDPDLPDKQQLENFMLMYEKIIYGEVQAEGADINVFTEKPKNDSPKNVASFWVRKWWCYTADSYPYAKTCVEYHIWVDIGLPKQPEHFGPGGGGTAGPPDYGGGGGGPGGLSPVDLWVAKIDANELNPCMTDELHGLMNNDFEKGVGEIIKNFADDQLNRDPNFENWNWKVKDGDLDPNTNAVTSTDYNNNTNTVTTTFDSGKFENATNLSVVRTILHEAVHAYIVTIQYNTSTIEERKDLLGSNWFSAFVDPGHNYIATVFVNDIADALQTYGNSQGYNLSRQFYKDLAWGGLFRTSEFQSKSAAEKQRVKDVVLTELTGRDSNGNYQSQKGGDAG